MIILKNIIWFLIYEVYKLHFIITLLLHRLCFLQTSNHIFLKLMRILKVFFKQGFFQLFFLLTIFIFLIDLNFTNCPYYLLFMKIQWVLIFLIKFLYSILIWLRSAIPALLLIFLIWFLLILDWHLIIIHHSEP